MRPRALRQGGVAAAATRALAGARAAPGAAGREAASGRGSGREPNRSAPPPGPARRRLRHCCARERPTRRLAARSEPDLRAGVGECGPRARAFRPGAGSAAARLPAGWKGHSRGEGVLRAGLRLRDGARPLPGRGAPLRAGPAGGRGRDPTPTPHARPRPVRVLPAPPRGLASSR